MQEKVIILPYIDLTDSKGLLESVKSGQDYLVYSASGYSICNLRRDLDGKLQFASKRTIGPRAILSKESFKKFMVENYSKESYSSDTFDSKFKRILNAFITTIILLIIVAVIALVVGFLAYLIHLISGLNTENIRFVMMTIIGGVVFFMTNYKRK